MVEDGRKMYGAYAARRIYVVEDHVWPCLVATQLFGSMGRPDWDNHSSASLISICLVALRGHKPDNFILKT